MVRSFRSRRALRGFTLLEILVVLSIIAIFTAMIAQNIFGEVDKAKITAAVADVQTLDAALNRYKLDNYVYPTTEQGLAALVQRPVAPPEPRNYPSSGYIPRLPLDPWKNAYQYLQPGRTGDFEVFSLGADGKLGGEGQDADISNRDPARP